MVKNNFLLTLIEKFVYIWNRSLEGKITTEDKFSTLRTKPQDEVFHQARIMFIILGDEIKIGPTRTKDCHLDWFKREGWIAENEENAEDFLNTHIRGFFLQSDNGLYCYIGVGFYFNKQVIDETLKRLPDLKDALSLNGRTKICFGPKDNPVNDIEYRQYCAGILKDLLRS